MVRNLFEKLLLNLAQKKFTVSIGIPLLLQVIFFLFSLCLAFSSMQAQNVVNRPNITFAIGSQRITVASNGDILSVAESDYNPYTYNNDIVIVSYSEVSVDVNREISVWKGDYYPSVFYFPIDKYLLIRDYRSNAIMLNALDELVSSRQLIEDVESIEIIGACSPIGSEEYNLQLALSRCMALRSYLRWKHLAFAESVPIKFSIIGVDRLGYNILKAQRPPLSEKQIGDRLQYAAIRLQMKDGSSIIPGSNRPKGIFEANTEISSKPVEPMYNLRDTVFVYLRDTLYLTGAPYTGEGEYPKTSKPVYMALKTNLLYDLALLPNLTIECYLGKQWSLTIEDNWNWWTFGSPVQNQWHYRIQMAGLELRRWFQSPYPLRGHALGLYSMVGNYDVRFSPKDENSTGYLSYLSWSAGVSYAYNFPLTRKLNLELGVAAGYVGGRYSTYNYCIPETQWEQQAIYNRKYIGLTRVGVSLVWQLGADNYMIYKNK